MADDIPDPEETIEQSLLESASSADFAPEELARFLRLSAVLTGYDDLNPRLAQRYRQHIASAGHDPALQDLYNQIEELAVGNDMPLTLEQLRENGGLTGENTSALVKSIVSIWYTGMFTFGGETSVVTTTEALAWRALDFTTPPTICATPGFWQTNPYADR